jgi:hypothetical protein
MQFSCPSPLSRDRLQKAKVFLQKHKTHSDLLCTFASSECFSTTLRKDNARPRVPLAGFDTVSTRLLISFSSFMRIYLYLHRKFSQLDKKLTPFKKSPKNIARAKKNRVGDVCLKVQSRLSKFFVVRLLRHAVPQYIVVTLTLAVIKSLSLQQHRR